MLFKDHAIEDNWRIYNNSIDVSPLSHYDQFIYNTLMARSYALNFKYKKSIKYYEITNDTLNHRNNIDKYTFAYNRINYAITKGYIGTYDEEKYKEEVEPYFQILEKNNEFEDDVINFSLALSDVAFNYRVRGIGYHIKRLNVLINKYPNKVSSSFIYIRLGVLHFIQYLITKDIKTLKASYQNFHMEIELSDASHYKNYWARCGYLVCSSILDKKIDPSIIAAPPLCL